jgi:hypothetical protein
MTHVIHIMEIIGGYILPLTTSMKVVNNDTYKLIEVTNNFISI